MVRTYARKPMAAAQWRREVDWVYRNLGVEDEKALKNPPSKGTLALWRAARADPQWFLSQFVAKLAGAKLSEEDQAARAAKQEREHQENMDQGIQRLEEWMNVSGYGQPPNDWKRNYQDARDCPLKGDCPALKAAIEQRR